MHGELGSVVVQIDNAERLVAEMQAALNSRDPWQRGATIALWSVEYTKGLKLPRIRPR